MASAKKTNQAVNSHENSVGVIRVHESVIASIVRKITLETDGVVRLAGSSLVDNLAEIVGSKKIQDRSITVEMGESSVSIEIGVIIKYGVAIPPVAEAIKTSVASEILKLTGMKVGKINIIVMDLEEETPEGI